MMHIEINVLTDVKMVIARDLLKYQNMLVYILKMNIPEDLKYLTMYDVNIDKIQKQVTNDLKRQERGTKSRQCTWKS